MKKSKLYIRRILYKAILATCFTSLTACSSMNIKNFESEKLSFKIEDYFQGKSEGTGVFFDRFGDLQRRFIVVLDTKTEGDITTMSEVLTYSDGEVNKRIFTITKKSEHLYEVTADGVVGTGTIESYGNALKWSYVLAQPIKGSIWHLTFDDWMFLQENNVVINKASAYKWGIHVGDVIMSLKKL